MRWAPMDHSIKDEPVVGRYREFELLEELGQGSFARVYKVRAPGHRRPLALKLATQARISDDVRKRAIREIAILRSLTNPHVARLHGSSIGEDHFYLLMDLVEGLQLDEYHDFDNTMSVGEALDLMFQASMGLVEAHAQGVVHRDIKPGNIIITPGGTVKMLDFGLARAWNVPWAFGTNATASRTVVGTPHYCQPEQLHTHQLTPASDVYSLATILYELLCGHAVLFADMPVTYVVEALRDNPVSWLDAHAMKEPVPIERYPGCAGLPDPLRSLLDLSLSKEPAIRPQNAGEFANALGRILWEDLGAVEPATLRMTQGDAELTLVPGRRAIGRAPHCELHVDDPQIEDHAAWLDWSGAPRIAQIRPTTGRTTLLKNGEPVRGVTELESGDILTVGSTRLVAIFPET